MSNAKIVLKDERLIAHVEKSYTGYVRWELQDIVRDHYRYHHKLTRWMSYMHPVQYLKSGKLVDIGHFKYTVWGQLINNPTMELYDLQLKMHELYKIHLANNTRELEALCCSVEINFFFTNMEYKHICSD